MRNILLILLLLPTFLSFSQTTINGIVKDRKDVPVFAANIYLKSEHQRGVTTDFGGIFNLRVDNLNDTLIVSFIGYKTREVLLSTINISEPVIVVLIANSKTLQELIITAQDPISEQFSVVKMNKLDIYLNPVSQGDPLKAITVLPASTTTNETANPSLRGSSADRSRVVLNGVPIYKPVRASQLNNQGFFSLFNPEIINKQYVYASNPPLTFGNTSAGLVEIQTIQSLKVNQLQLSASLASAGFFISQSLKKDISFIQVYGNYQFSDAFVGIQNQKLPDIKNFYTKDGGVNFHCKIGEKARFNSYNYFIDEQFNGYDEQFTYKGEVATNKRRFFTVNNLNIYSDKGALNINNGMNISKQYYNFGNIKSEQITNQIYTSIDYNWYLLKNANLQFGGSHNFHQNKFNDSIPTFYYALSPNSPSYYSNTLIHNHMLEAYLYTNWDINQKLTFSSGIRSNIPVEQQKGYFSAQLGLKYRLSKRNSFLLSGGQYHNYSIPSYYANNYNLLSSQQIALDYSYEFKNTLLKAATYCKKEVGDKSVDVFFESDRINTFGLEFYVVHDFYKYFKFSFANSFINQVMTIDNTHYNGFKDFNYLIKSTIQYNNPKLFSFAITYTSRPGTYYNEITGSTFNKKTNFYEPIFSTDLYNAQYANYNRVDISLNKYISMEKSAVIVFASINNILNANNESTPLYNSDYSEKHFDFYQFRTVYFGLVWQVNY